MAEQEEAVESEGRMTARRPVGGSPHVELKSFTSGEEAMGSSKRSPGAKSATPTTSSVASDVLGRHTDADLHASTLSSRLDPLSLAQSSTPSAAANSPSFRIQFTTPTGESLTPLHSSEHLTGSRDEVDLSHTDQALEELLTPERDDDDRRDSLTEVRAEGDGVGGDRSGLQQPASNQTVFDDTATRDFDSSGHGSAVSTPIAAPSNGDSSREPAASSATHSFVRELGMSPYVVVKGGLADVSQYESPGLLYARATKERHNLDMLRPPDEVAEDVLETFHGDVRQELREGEEEEGDKYEADGEGDGGERRKSARRKEGYRKSHSIESRGRIEDLDLTQDVSMSSLELSTEVMTPLDPNVLRDLERHAQKVASNLEYIMDNLRNSLHAMTVCAKQSVMLHRESVDNLHAVVDSNVKATYSFLAKFEELKRHTVPLNDLAQQIRDINEILKVLERGFRTA